MQGIMVLVLAATLGLAGLVREWRSHAAFIDLGRKASIGPFTLRLPYDWEVFEGQSLQPSADFIEAVEPVNPKRKQTGRRIRILMEAVPGTTSSETYLHNTWKVPTSPSEPIKMLGQKGLVVQFRSDGANFPRNQIYACAVLQQGVAITILLDGSAAENENQDIELVRDLASQIGLGAPVSND